jgi:uncharacterized membrane protein HdeD (DUF308 family)
MRGASQHVLSFRLLRAGDGFYNEPASKREKSVVRERWFVIASVAYIAAGLIIVARSVLAHVIPLVILGIVFVALGAVRLRDYFAQGGRTK